MKKKLLFLAIALSLNADIIKKNVDLNEILSQIDAIAKNIEENQKRLQELRQKEPNPNDPNMMPPPNQPPQEQLSKEQLLEKKLAEEEAKLNLKQKELELAQRKQEFNLKLYEIKKKDKNFLIKKANEVVKELRKKLYELSKKNSYVIKTDKFMKIANNIYAYVPNQKLQEAKKFLENNNKQIEKIKENIKKIEKAKKEDPMNLFNILSLFDNSLQDRPDQLQEDMASLDKNPPLEQASQSEPQSIAQNFVTSMSGGAKDGYKKLKLGDSYDSLFVKYIDTEKVILSFKEDI